MADYDSRQQRSDTLNLQSRAVKQALELTRTQGHTLTEWMWALNIGPRSSPSRLLEVSAILEVVRLASTRPTNGSCAADRPSADKYHYTLRCPRCGDMQDVTDTDKPMPLHLGCQKHGLIPVHMTVVHKMKAND